MYSGWYQAAYERDLVGEITPVEIGERRIALLREGRRIRAIDAACPHRSANLAVGGRLDGSVVVCPFHGKRIGIGLDAPEEYRVREHPTLGYGGLVFVRLGDAHENGLERLLERIATDHFFIPGFALEARVAPAIVIENAVDDAHFHAVHSVVNEPSFSVRPTEFGEFAVEGEFVVPASEWQREAPDSRLAVPFVARVFSPNLIVSQMGGSFPYWVLTAATPTSAGHSLIRMSLAVPAGPGGAPPDEDRCRYLMRQSRAGIEQDLPIWENLVPGARPQLGPGDGAVIAYRKFCRGFLPGTS